jgi:Protein of unknown function (DUF4240)
MSEDDFWILIDTIDQATLRKGEGYDREAIQPLVEALSVRSKDELEAFEDHLAQSLFALDGRRFADAAGASSNSDDGFLYARCFVVASGRSAFNRTLADPKGMPKTLDEWCEPLLYAASWAWKKTRQTEWEYSTSVSYETGSNKALW